MAIVGSRPHMYPPWRDTYDGPRFPDTPAFDEKNIRDKTGPVALLPRLTLRERRQLGTQVAQRRESIEQRTAPFAVC
jgi:hypothetical protein